MQFALNFNPNHWFNIITMDFDKFYTRLYTRLNTEEPR